MIFGIAVLVRMRRWGVWRAMRALLLGVLHMGHAWLGLGLMLHGLTGMTGLPATLGLHATSLGGLSLLSLGPLWAGASYLAVIHLSAGLFAAAFALYLVRNAWILCTPRPDGQPGQEWPRPEALARRPPARGRE